MGSLQYRGPTCLPLQMRTINHDGTQSESPVPILRRKHQQQLPNSHHLQLLIFLHLIDLFSHLPSQIGVQFVAVRTTCPLALEILADIDGAPYKCKY